MSPNPAQLSTPRAAIACLALALIAPPAFAAGPFGPSLPAAPAGQPAKQGAEQNTEQAAPPIESEPLAKPVATGEPAQPEQLPLGQPAQQEIESKPSAAPTSAILSVRSIGSLALVLALVLVLKVILTRAARSSGSFSARLGAGGRAPSGVLEVLGRYPVARGITLVLLRLDRRVLLLSQSPEGFATLAELTDPDDIASILTKTADDEGESLSAKFASLLSRFERDHTIIEEPIDIPEPRYAAQHEPYARSGAEHADDIQSHLARIRELQG